MARLVFVLSVVFLAFSDYNRVYGTCWECHALKFNLQLGQTMFLDAKDSRFSHMRSLMFLYHSPGESETC